MSNKFSIYNQLDHSTKIISYAYEVIKIFFGPTNKHCLHSNAKNQIVLLTNSSAALSSFDFANETSRTIIKLLEHACAQTLKSSGGGSTVTALLTCQLLMSALRFSFATYNVIQIVNGLNQISFFLRNQLLELSGSISTNNQLESLIKSAVGKKLSPTMMSLLCQASFNIKRDGLIVIEEATLLENKIDLIHGIELDSGFASSYFVNDQKNFEVLYNNPYLLILDKPLSFSFQLKEVINFIQKENAPLVIIAEAISDEVLSTLILNSIKKKLKIVAIKYRPIKFVKTGLLEDLALLAYNVVRDEASQSEVLNLGQVKQAIIQKNKSTFIFSKFTKITAQRRINELNRELLLSETDYERNNIKTRIARLSNNVIKIKLGNSNEYQMQDERQKAQGLINNINGALEEGCVPGGGAIYLYLREELKFWGYLNLIGEEIYSMQIVSEALTRPFLQLLENTNTRSQSLLEEVNNFGYPFAYNFIEKKIVDAYKNGLLDSTKQTRLSLLNSISLSSAILTSN